MTKIARQHNIHAKLASEGYCCVYGYLKLGQSQGLTPVEMMAPLGFSRLTFYHHARKLANGQYTCRNRSDCLKACFEEPTPEGNDDGVPRGSDKDLGKA